MAADLLSIYGATLPEQWRQERFPSFRRLLVIVRHLPPTSACARVLGEWWTTEHDLLDDIRRATSVAVKGNQDMHPDRPAAKAIAAAEAAKTAKREHALAASRQREADRQQRLAAQEEGVTNG